MNTKQLNISIPKPCHEDWDNMTPNEQGAFCKKCCKSVIDFSKKSTQEISDILLSTQNKKICGKFNSNQLVENPQKLTIPYNLLPKNISLPKAFAIALFIVFGTGLFSCQSEYGHTVGEIAVIDTLSHEPEIAPIEKLLGDTIYNKELIEVKGGVEYNESKDSTVCVPKTDTTSNIEIKMGKVSIPK